MKLVLTVYKDDCLTEIDRVVEADRLKIPYRVAMYIGQSLETVNIDNEQDLLNFVTTNLEYIDKIVRATFGLSESELECVDAGELGNVAVELYKWGSEKLKSIKGKNPKNAPVTA